MFLMPIFLFILSVNAAPFQCPPGTEMKGEAPPNGLRAYCVKSDDTDVLHGPLQTWYSNGQKKQLVEYENGKISGKKMDWGTTGKLIQSWDYKNGKPHGKWTTYSPNGRPRRVVRFEDGKMIGEETFHHEAPRRVAKPAAPLSPTPENEAKTEPVPTQAQTPTDHEVETLTCALRSTAVENWLASSKKKIETLTYGQLALKGELPRLRVTLKEDKVHLYGEKVSLKIETTSELPIGRKDPIHRTVGKMAKRGATVIRNLKYDLVRLIDGFELHQKKLAELGLFNFVMLRPEFPIQFLERGYEIALDESSYTLKKGNSSWEVPEFRVSRFFDILVPTFFSYSSPSTGKSRQVIEISNCTGR